jgi:hypothetical protein
MASPEPRADALRRHECERVLVGRVVRFNDREWVVCTVDHLNRVGDLRGVVTALGGGWADAPGYSIRSVPIDELAGMAGCSCGLHGWSGVPAGEGVAGG